MRSGESQSKRLKLILMVNVKGVHEQRHSYSYRSVVFSFNFTFGEMSADAWGLRSTACSRYCSLPVHAKEIFGENSPRHMSPAHNHPRNERNLIAQQPHSEFPFLTWWFLKTNEEFLTRMSRARDYNKYHYSLPSILLPSSLARSHRIRLPCDLHCSFVGLTYTIVKKFVL